MAAVTKKSKIDYIHVFGMRCSGTNHLRKTLLLNIAGTPKRHITENYVGWKHDDVWSHSGVTDALNDTIQFDERPKSPSILYNSLIIVIYRNPITWLQSLHTRPHQAPRLVSLGFSEFIRSPFEGFYTPVGKDFSEDKEERDALIRPDHVWERYPDLFTLRSTKIHLFESFQYRFPNVCYVNLENLIGQPQNVLQAISEHYGIALNKTFRPDTKDKHSDRPYQPKQYATVNRNDFTHILVSLGLREEKMAGYLLKRSYRPIKVGNVLVAPKNPESVFVRPNQIRFRSYVYGDRAVDFYS